LKASLLAAQSADEQPLSTRRNLKGAQLNAST